MTAHNTEKLKARIEARVGRRGRIEIEALALTISKIVADLPTGHSGEARNLALALAGTAALETLVMAESVSVPASMRGRKPGDRPSK